MSSCPVSYFEEVVTLKCKECSQNCNKCSNATNCTQCADGFYRYEDHCYSKCSNFTETITKVCIVKDGKYLEVDLSVKPMIELIESSSSTTIVMNFFPSTMLLITLSILTLTSYLIDKKT